MDRKAAALRWALLALAGVGYFLACRGAAIGGVEDDAVHLLLSKSLRSGVFSYPDPSGAPMTDPLPGFAALLLLPAWLAEPHWRALQAVGWTSALAALVLSWKLAARLLAPAWALAAVVLTACNPQLLAYLGVIVPDIPYLALSLALILGVGARRPRWAWLAAGAAGAMLLKPHGALLGACMALVLGYRRGPRAAFAFTAAAFAPLAAWLLRSRLLAGTSTDYLNHWRAGAAQSGGLEQLSALSSSFLGEGWLSIATPLAALGLLAAGAGAARLARRGDDDAVFVAAAYAACVLSLHATWSAIDARYVLTILPLLWIFALAAASGSGRRLPAWAPAAACALLLIPAIPKAARALSAGLRGPARFQPRTMAFLRESAPASSPVETLAHASVRLLSGRAAQPPEMGATTRDAWLAAALARGVRHAHVFNSFPAGGYQPEQAGLIASRMEAWARTSGYARLVFEDDVEGTSVFELRHPRPARFTAAWDEYVAGSRELNAGRPERARAALRRAVSLEPTLAYAWASLAMIERAPASRRRLLERAARADPGAADIAAELAAQPR